MGGRVLALWWDAHEARDRQRQIIAAETHEILGVLRGNTRLLRFLARVDLDEETNGLSGGAFFERRLQGFRKTRPVERLDAIEELHRFARLVGLQGADQMKLRIRIFADQLRPFGAGLLDSVFAEQAVAGFKGGQDLLAPLPLGHGDETRFGRRVHGGAPRGGDALAYRG